MILPNKQFLLDDLILPRSLNIDTRLTPPSKQSTALVFVPCALELLYFKHFQPIHDHHSLDETPLEIDVSTHQSQHWLIVS